MQNNTKKGEWLGMVAVSFKILSLFTTELTTIR